MHWNGIISPIFTAFVTTGNRVTKGSCLLESAWNEELPPSIRVDQSKYNSLLDWVKSKEGSFIHPAITIAPSELGDGYGVYVTDAVSEGEILFSIPRSACVTVEDATNDPECGKTFRTLIDKAGPGGNTVVLAGFLARERLRSLDHKKSPETVENSSFGPYLETLPWEQGINNQQHILFWDEEKVNSLLPGSMCLDEAETLRAEVDLAIKVINGIVGRSIRKWRGDGTPEGFQWPWEAALAAAENKEIVDQLPEAVKGAFVSLLTRSFQDSISQTGQGADDPEKLVPLLDLLQHVDEPNISHFMKADTGEVQVVARQSLAEGEELLNQYRSEMEETMPYHRFFTRFGFVPGIDEPMENLFLDKSSIFFAQKAEV